MSVPSGATTHRGVTILIVRKEDGTRYFFATIDEETFEDDSVSNVIAWIDEKLGPEEEPPEPEPIEEEPEVEEPVEEEPEPEEIELIELVAAPALPFYAAWLAPIVEYIGALTTNVVNYFAPLFAPIKETADAVVALPGAIVDSLVERSSGLFKKTRDSGANMAVDTLSEMLKGTEPWMKTLSEDVDTAQTIILEQYAGAIQGAITDMEEGDLEKAVEVLDQLRLKVLAASIVNFGLHAALETGSLGQIEFMKDLDPMVISKLGLDAVISRATMLPIEKSILNPAEQEYNRRYPHILPAPAELIQMVVKEVITLDDFKVSMLRQGIAEVWSQAIWDAHFIPPSYTEIRQALYRGIVTPEQFEALKTLVDLDPRFKAIWDGLLEQIPPVSELINQRTREVLTQDDFTKFLGWYGFKPEWAERIWAAHFIPPNLNDLLTSWRRGEITTERLDELEIIIDLDPRFKDIFDTRRYVDPSITQARFMFETGSIDEAGVRDIILRNGYTEADTDNITRYIVKFQERRFRTSYLIALATGAIYGAFTDEEVLEQVTEAGYTEATAEWLIKAAQVRGKTSIARAKAPGPKLLGLGDIKKAFMTDIIDEDVFRRELTMREYEQGDIDIMARLMNESKVTKEAGGRKIALSQSELLNAWRYDEVKEDYVRIELALRGMEESEIDILLATKRKQWGIG